VAKKKAPMRVLVLALIVAVALAGPGGPGPKGAVGAGGGGFQSWAFTMTPNDSINVRAVAQYGAVTLYAACYFIPDGTDPYQTSITWSSSLNDPCSTSGNLYVGYLMTDTSRSDLTTSSGGYFPSPVTSQPGSNDGSSPDAHCDATNGNGVATNPHASDSVQPQNYADQYYYSNLEGDIFQYQYNFAEPVNSYGTGNTCEFSGYAIGTAGWNGGPAAAANNGGLKGGQR